MRVAVIGQGYVGLAASTGLAAAGHEVVGVEREPARLERLRGGVAPIFEPGLDEALRHEIDAGRLTFSAGLSEIPGHIDLAMIAVGSPQLPSGGTDLGQVAGAFAEVAALEDRPDAVVLKSTVPPGTSDRLMAEHGKGLRERYILSPEFLSQGSALRDWNHPSRIVAGIYNPALEAVARDLYRGLDAPTLVTSPINAEMVKYASNAFLATKISFVNEIANLCDSVGADIEAVTQGMGYDSRIGSSYMRAGIGYGGSCFPKDTRALAYLSNVAGGSMRLLEAVIAVNEAQRLRVINAVRSELGPRPGGEVAVLGLTFKPNTDDLRDAPSHTVVSELLAHGLRVRAWDPVLTPAGIAQAFPGATPAASLDEAVRGALAATILTEWPVILEADWSALASSMEAPRLVVDGRNCLASVHASGIAKQGGVYRSIGRPRIG